MAIIKDYSGVRDAWADTHPDVPTTFSPNATPLEVLHTFGVTTDSPANIYSAGKSLDDYARQFMGKRLDYVLYRPPIHSFRSSKIPILEPTQADVVFTEHVPGKSYPLSDHFGLEATFAIHSPKGQPGNVNNPSDIEVPAPTPNTITENRPPGAKSDPSQQVAAVSNLQPNPPPGLSDASITTLIQALTTSYRLSRSSSRLNLVVSFICLVVVIGLIVSSVWLPHSWITPIFHFTTTVLTWLATTTLYAGFIYGNYEANTLGSTIEELELYRETIRGD